MSWSFERIVLGNVLLFKQKVLIQSTPVIWTLHISNNGLSQRENHALVLWKSNNRKQDIMQIFLLFSTVFNTSLTMGIKLHIHLFVRCGCLIYFFLSSVNLIYICRGMDISKYFRGPLDF